MENSLGMGGQQSAPVLVQVLCKLDNVWVGFLVCKMRSLDQMISELLNKSKNNNKVF